MEESIVFLDRRLSRKNHMYRFAGEFGQNLLKNAADEEDFPGLL